MSKTQEFIYKDIQDRDSLAWKKLCEYVEIVAESESDDFFPFEYLGQDLFSQICTLPESISKLTRIKKMWLYGSKIRIIPPAIGNMQSLEFFDPYTSYSLFWFPYEILKCENLKDSRVSTRVLYGNYKNRRTFPSLKTNPVRYYSSPLSCSCCGKEITYDTTNQYWISTVVGTDVLPLLANVCSEECKNSLQKPAKEYVQYPHKGGIDLIQPLDEEEKFEIEFTERFNNKEEEKENEIESKRKEPSLFQTLKLITKIWKK